MTKREINALFGLFALNWPSSSFAKTDPKEKMTVISLWEKCTPDIDWWTAEQAAIRLLKECKFAPTIAEFREKAADVTHDLELEATTAMNILILERRSHRLAEFINGLPPENKTRVAFEANGATKDLSNFMATYIRVAKQGEGTLALKAIGAKSNEQV